MTELSRVLEKLSIVVISAPHLEYKFDIDQSKKKRPRKCVVTSNFGMGGSKAQKKISNLKRKIRQQASKHVHSCKEKDLEIQELKLRERHHDIIFRDALRYIYHPYGNQRCIYYTNWDKEVADGFHSAYHEIDYR